VLTKVRDLTMKTIVHWRFALSTSIALALSLGCSGDDGAPPGSGTEGGTDSGSDSTQGTGSADTSGVDGSGSSGSGPTTDTDGTDTGSETGSVPGVACLDMQYVGGLSPGPNYAEVGVPIGSHCMGTNQQDITDIERIVFIGDSVTVGTPPAGSSDFYRTIVAQQLATHFGIEAPASNWNSANPLTGMSGVMESGAFASCAEWGARNDDLLTQLEQCFEPEDFAVRTLVITTMGGNDVSAIAQDYINGEPLDQVFAEVEEMIANHEAAVKWLTTDNRFSNGIFVVNANVYEYTDYTAEVLVCPAANTVGFSGNPDDPTLLLSTLNLINEEYMRIAIDNGTDVAFMFEGFCGHGFHSDDPANVCFRGPGNANWFDFTCIHPTPEGHAALADMFINTVTE
jgi:lysophospholipase L1-like esterase